VAIHLGALSDERLASLVVTARELPLSYPSVGMTRTGTAPPGYRLARYEADLGAGDEVFARARDGLRAWVPQRGAGARVVPADAPLAVGQTVIVAMSRLGMTVTAPCRILDVTDEPGRFGFTYGALVGHPERGEEAFHVVRDGDRTSFRITVCSRPALLLARLGGPIARRVQAALTRRYLAAMEDVAAGR
jgi:uncharacterized protein (UPF0548 family)